MAHNSTRYTYAGIAALFLLSGLVTAVFSGSLAALASHARLPEVLTVGLVVPTFTWAVQLSASRLLLREEQRKCYWGSLGVVCLIGSFALLPAGVVNLVAASPRLWFSAANVLVSAALMGAILFRLCAARGLSLWWPLSWCLTICTNMAIFVTVSRHWW